MTRAFARGERASVAVESALALGVLVGAFSALMHVVGDAFAEDRAGRGARAVARALALDPSKNPWEVLKKELGPDAGAACPAWSAAADTCGGWRLRIDHRVAPAALPEDLAAGVSSSAGELVLVRLVRGATVSLGLARREPEA